MFKTITFWHKLFTWNPVGDVTRQPSQVTGSNLGAKFVIFPKSHIQRPIVKIFTVRIFHFCDKNAFLFLCNANKYKL